MENILQKIEKNWKLCLHDESTKKNTKKNRKSRPLRVIVCVSGGSDSIALIHLLHRLSSLLFLELYILHIHHTIFDVINYHHIYLQNNVRIELMIRVNKTVHNNGYK